MKTKLAIATALGLMLASPAFAADSSYEAKTEVKKNDDGSYKKTTSQENSDKNGSISAETKEKVDVNKDGTVDKSVETKTTDDPKGLMNKTTTKTKDSVKHKNGKIVSKHKKTVNGDTVEDTEKEVK